MTDSFGFLGRGSVGSTVVSEGDAAAGGVVAADLDLDSVAGDDEDLVLLHLAGHVAEDDVIGGVEADSEHAVGQRLHYHPLLVHLLLFLRTAAAASS